MHAALEQAPTLEAIGVRRSMARVGADTIMLGGRPSPRRHAPLAGSLRAELEHVASQAHNHLIQVLDRSVDPGP